MNRNSLLFKILSRFVVILPYGGKSALYSDSMRSWLGSPEDLKPVVPKPEIKLDTSPEAVEERTKAARRSLIFPMAAIAGVVIVFVLAIIFRG